MSSVNPLAGSATGAGASDAVALEVAALKADAEALRALLSRGDIVAAKVLPFNGLTDLIQILGKRVAASLPPTVRPGDTLILEVSGFDGDRIIVRNLGTETNPQPQRGAAQTAAAAAEALSEAVISHAITPGTLPEQTVRQAAAELAFEEPAAGEPAPQAAQTSPATQGTAAQPRPDRAAAQSPRSAAPEAPAASGPGSYPRVTIAIPPRAIETDRSIEARLIAARATVKPPPAGTGPAQTRPGAAPAVTASGPRGEAAAPVRAPGQPARGVASPNVPRTPAWIETARLSAEELEATATPAPAAQAAPGRAPDASSPAQRTAETYREPVLLLRSLHIPVTPTNVAAAKLALETPQRLPVALAALERSLPLGNADPRVNTMRTIAAFVTNVDPRSESFPAQLSAYIGHVLDGPEPKLSQLLQAFAQAAPEPAAPAPAPQPLPGQPAAGAQPHPVHDAPAGTATPSPQAATPSDVSTIARQDPVLAAKIAERSAAVDYDLKTQLQAFIAQPPPGASAASLTAAQSALAALTATQLNNAVAQVDPRSLTINIPLPFTSNGAPAQIKISREKPQKRESLDADNFHIAFVLETKNVGTVAIDLQTVGRAVNLAVKSETPRYAATFKSMLDQLGGRLERMRYNVVSLDSSVVSRAGATIGTAAPAPPSEDEQASGLDMRA